MDTQELNRRGFLAAGGIGAALLMSAGKAEAAEASDIEKANLKVVNDFCAAWETMDVDKLGSFLADNVAFRMFDAAPRISGKEDLIVQIKQFLRGAIGVRFEMLRSNVIGNVVINERIDHFDRGEKKNAYHITGFFLVKNGKIVEWQDYMMPQA